MHRLQLARQGYEELATELASSLDERISDRAEAWLRDEVCPVVEEVLQNPSFRLAARWSMDHLTPGVNTSVRRFVEALDASLVRYAAALADVTSPEAVAIPTSRAHAVIGRPEYEMIELVAGRPWFDLTIAEEFFEEHRGLNLCDPSSKHESDFARGFAPCMTLGDSIVRAFLVRVEYWKTRLDRIWFAVIHQLMATSDQGDRAVERATLAKIDSESAIEQVTRACRSGNEVRRREACVVLTQVYAAYSAVPNVDWLDGPPGWAEANRGLVRLCIRRPGKTAVVGRDSIGSLTVGEGRIVSVCDVDVLRQIARALGDVASLYELPADPDDLVDWAKDRARLLVVDRSPRAVYWEGNVVAEERWDQHSREWNLLWTLAIQPGEVVDQMMLMIPDKNPIRSRRNRLSRLLDQVLDLDGLIDSVRGQGYTLRLAPEDILCLRDIGDNRLEFEGGTRRPTM